MTRAAAIDIGTNSVLLVVAENGFPPSPVVERATITRLGQDVDRARALHPEACDRTLACLRDYAAELRRHDVERLDVVGTSAMRDAAGGDDFVQRAEEILGVRPRVISGEEEARLTFEGAMSGLDLSGDVLVFDVGGGSTEVIAGTVTPDQSTARTSQAVSLDVGSVRLTERHVETDPPTPAELDAASQDVRRALEGALAAPRGATLVGVAGTVTTLAAIELELRVYDAAVVHGAKLSRSQVSALRSRLATTPLSQRRRMAGLEPKRADVIVCGSIIVVEVLAWSGAPELVVSDRGVRWGLVQRLLSR